MNNLSFRELTNGMISLYNDGNYSKALQFVEDRAAGFPDQAPRITFWRMCLLSLCGRVDDVLALFQESLNSGLWWAENQFLDSDFDAIRDLPRFKHLVAISQERYEEARKHIERDQAVLEPEAPTSGSYPLLIALHGGGGNKESNLEYWEVAHRKGWLVLSPQSTQPLYTGAYCWIDGEQGLTDVAYYVEQISKEYPIDPQRVITAGFSQGSGMAIYVALSGKLDVRGFIGIGTYWAEPSSFISLAKHAKHVRGYFVTGEKDRTLDKTREIQQILKENDVQFAEEIYSDLGHEFPSDFETSFDRAIDFIFKEHE